MLELPEENWEKDGEKAHVVMLSYIFMHMYVLWILA